MSSLRTRISDFGRAQPGLFAAAICVLAIFTIILLLYQIKQPTVVYENF